MQRHTVKSLIHAHGSIQKAIHAIESIPDSVQDRRAMELNQRYLVELRKRRTRCCRLFGACA